MFSKLRSLFTKGRTLSFLSALIIFIFCYEVFSKNSSDWENYPDTRGYILQQLKNPWKGVRSPGMTIFYRILGVDADLKKNYPVHARYKDEVKKLAKNFSIVNTSFLRIAFVQTVIMAFAFVLLYFALSQFIPKSIAFFFCVLCIAFTPLPSPRAILSDSLSTSLCIIFMSVTFFWFSKNKLYSLFLLCLVAVYAVQVRPDFGFLSLVSLILCIVKFFFYIFHKMKWQSICTVFIIIFLCGGTLIWPVWLSIKGGFITTGQVEYMAKRAFGIHILEKGDEDLYSDKQSKAIITDLINEKPAFDEELNNQPFFAKGRENYSPAYIFHYTLHPYAYPFYEENARKHVKWHTLPQMVRQTNNIFNPIIRKHLSKYLALVMSNFLSSINFYPDLPHPYFNNNLKQILPSNFIDNVISKFTSFLFGFRLNFYIFIFSYIIIILGLIFSKNRSLRFSLMVTSSLYLLHMLLISMGHGLFGRYPPMSLISLEISTLISLYIIFERWMKYRCKH